MRKSLLLQDTQRCLFDLPSVFLKEPHPRDKEVYRLPYLPSSSLVPLSAIYFKMRIAASPLPHFPTSPLPHLPTSPLHNSGSTEPVMQNYQQLMLVKLVQ
ncbi:unknown protein [Microcystis aeruginosa NIES-843]|uniref:Uncharacterized protein n=1 Tax=Microcystis aeruginosa (strain NIES-843 / IAM M-2473) TaxID=449447 RepID=B0JXV5_MICAN|nr:unknown protein [Microcystis aeruginosa NIES-843]